MAARFPIGTTKVELGVGLDLQWDQDPGLVKDPIRGDVVSDRVVELLHDRAASASHLTICWQPRRRTHVEARDYFPAYDDLFGRIGHRFASRALHHTSLSRRAVEAYRRGELLEVTNALADRYGFAWVSEDVGLWPIQGKPPNATGPRLDQEGLWSAIRHARVVRAGLEVPLLVDFPGFATSAGAHEGPIHAYDFFRAVAEEADVAVAFDTAKLLAHQWERDRRGADLFGELEKLPLARCYEIHVSGRDAKSGRSFGGPGDALLDAQLGLLERLAPVCPNVRVIAYEGPLFDANGEPSKATIDGFARLRDAVASWKAKVKANRPLEVQV
jgi:uncharacterized protein (UPF0276 family)